MDIRRLHWSVRAIVLLLAALLVIYSTGFMVLAGEINYLNKIRTSASEIRLADKLADVKAEVNESKDTNKRAGYEERTEEGINTNEGIDSVFAGRPRTAHLGPKDHLGKVYEDSPYVSKRLSNKGLLQYTAQWYLAPGTDTYYEPSQWSQEEFMDEIAALGYETAILEYAVDEHLNLKYLYLGVPFYQLHEGFHKQLEELPEAYIEFKVDNQWTEPWIVDWAAAGSDTFLESMGISDQECGYVPVDLASLGIKSDDQIEYIRLTYKNADGALAADQAMRMFFFPDEDYAGRIANGTRRYGTFNNGIDFVVTPFHDNSSEGHRVSWLEDESQKVEPEIYMQLDWTEENQYGKHQLSIGIRNNENASEPLYDIPELFLSLPIEIDIDNADSGQFFSTLTGEEIDGSISILDSEENNPGRQILSLYPECEVIFPGNEIYITLDIEISENVSEYFEAILYTENFEYSSVMGYTLENMAELLIDITAKGNLDQNYSMKGRSTSGESIGLKGKISGIDYEKNEKLVIINELPNDFRLEGPVKTEDSEEAYAEITYSYASDYHQAKRWLSEQEVENWSEIKSFRICTLTDKAKTDEVNYSFSIKSSKLSIDHETVPLVWNKTYIELNEDNVAGPILTGITLVDSIDQEESWITYSADIIGKQVTYQSEIYFGNGSEHWELLQLKNNLHYLMELIEVKVLNEQFQDVTEKGILDIDDGNITFTPYQRSDSYDYLAGQKWQMIIKAEIIDEDYDDIIKNLTTLKYGIPEKPEHIYSNWMKVDYSHLQSADKEASIQLSQFFNDTRNLKLESEGEIIDWKVEFYWSAEKVMNKTLRILAQMNEIFEMVDYDITDADGQSIKALYELEEDGQAFALIPDNKLIDQADSSMLHTFTFNIKIRDDLGKQEINRYASDGVWQNELEVQVVNEEAVIESRIQALPARLSMADVPPEIKLVYIDSQSKDSQIIQAEVTFGNTVWQWQESMIICQIDQMMRIDHIYVKDENGEDVQAYGEIKVEKDQLIFTFNPIDDSLNYLAGHTYYFEILASEAKGKSESYEQEGHQASMRYVSQNKAMSIHSDVLETHIYERSLSMEHMVEDQRYYLWNEAEEYITWKSTIDFGTSVNEWVDLVIKENVPEGWSIEKVSLTDSYENDVLESGKLTIKDGSMNFYPETVENGYDYLKAEVYTLMVQAKVKDKAKIERKAENQVIVEYYQDKKKVRKESNPAALIRLGDHYEFLEYTNGQSLYTLTDHEEALYWDLVIWPGRASGSWRDIRLSYKIHEMMELIDIEVLSSRMEPLEKDYELEIDGQNIKWNIDELDEEAVVIRFYTQVMKEKITKGQFNNNTTLRFNDERGEREMTTICSKLFISDSFISDAIKGSSEQAEETREYTKIDLTIEQENGLFQWVNEILFGVDETKLNDSLTETGIQLEIGNEFHIKSVSVVDKSTGKSLDSGQYSFNEGIIRYIPDQRKGSYDYLKGMEIVMTVEAFYVDSFSDLFDGPENDKNDLSDESGGMQQYYRSGLWFGDEKAVDWIYSEWKKISYTVDSEKLLTTKEVSGGESSVEIPSQKDDLLAEEKLNQKPPVRIIKSLVNRSKTTTLSDRNDSLIYEAVFQISEDIIEDNITEDQETLNLWTLLPDEIKIENVSLRYDTEDEALKNIELFEDKIPYTVQGGLVQAEIGQEMLSDEKGQHIRLSIEAVIDESISNSDLAQIMTNGGMTSKFYIQVIHKDEAYMISSDQLTVKIEDREPEIKQYLNSANKYKISEYDSHHTWQSEINFGNTVTDWKDVSIELAVPELIKIIDLDVLDDEDKIITDQFEIDDQEGIIQLILKSRDNSYSYLADTSYKIIANAVLDEALSSEEITAYVDEDLVHQLKLAYTSNTQEKVVEAKPVAAVIEERETIISQSANNCEEFVLEQRDEMITWSSNISFGNKTSEWQHIILENQLPELLEIISVKLMNSSGQQVIFDAVIEIEDQVIQCEFKKKGGSFAYLADCSYQLIVETRIKDSRSDHAIMVYMENGGIRNEQKLFISDSSGELMTIRGNEAFARIGHHLLVINEKAKEKSSAVRTSDDGYVYQMRILLGFSLTYILAFILVRKTGAINV